MKCEELVICSRNMYGCAHLRNQVCILKHSQSPIHPSTSEKKDKHLIICHCIKSLFSVIITIDT